jgi:lipopolysaccharide export system ATP-binding protein
MAIFRAERLKKSFNQRAVVKGVDLELHSGQIIALLGRNGAGKTTTFHMMMGLIKPDSGTLWLDDRNINRLTTPQRAAAGITYLPQENSVFLKTSTQNNLKMILELTGKSQQETNEASRALLQELGLAELAEQPAHSLSGGERRKLEICRSLVLDPKFLLLDEPFTGIDPLTIIELQKILLRLKAKNIGIVISDHNVRDALRITDRAYIIDDGEILVEGAPREVAGDECAKERFLGQAFTLGDEVQSSLVFGEKQEVPQGLPQEKQKKEKIETKQQR